MAISTLGHSLALQNMVDTLQQQLSTTQIQVSTGLKTSTYDGLGTQATLSISLRNQVTQLNAYNDTITTVQTRTNMMDQTMNQIESMTTDVRDTLLQSLTPGGDPSLLQNGASSALDQVVSELSTAVSGRYLYSGAKISTPPLVATSTVQTAVKGIMFSGTAYVTPANTAAMDTQFATSSNYYNGDSTTTTAQIDQNTTVNYGIQADNPAFRDVLEGLHILTAATKPSNPASATYTTDLAAYNTWVSHAQDLLNTGMSQLNQLIGKNGQVQTTMTNTQNNNSAVLVTVNTEISNINDVDAYTAASKLTQLQTQLQSAYATTGRLANLSLANYI